MQDHANDVKTDRFLRREFNECAEHVAHVHLLDVLSDLHEDSSGVAVVHDLLVDKDRLVVLGTCGLRRGEGEVEDMFGGALVTQFTGRRLRVDGEARRLVSMSSRH